MATSEAVRERPILFSAPMVKAIIAGQKAQTRRAFRPQPLPCDHAPYKAHGAEWSDKPTEFYEEQPGFWACRYCGNGVVLDTAKRDAHGIACPYGRVGDRLWVREAHCLNFNAADMDNARQADTGCESECRYTADGVQLAVTLNAADVQKLGRRRAGQPGKLQPGRFMYRSCSRITLEVTGVRVERLQAISEADAIAEGVDAVSVAEVPRNGCWNRREDFAQLWEIINGKGSWKANPWVWAVEFRKASAE